LNLKKYTKYIFIFVIMIFFCNNLYSQIGIVEILPFKKDNIVLLNFKPGYDIDNDGLTEVIGIATYCDSRGNIIRGTSILAGFEQTEENDFELFWQYNLPENISGDFTDLLFTDIDNDGTDEIIATANYYNTQLNNMKNPNFYLFKITKSRIIEDSFLSSNGKELKNIISINTYDMNGDGNQRYILLTNGKEPGIFLFDISYTKKKLTYKKIYNIPSNGFAAYSLLTGNFDNNQGDEIVIIGKDENIKFFMINDTSDSGTLIFTDTLNVKYDYKNIISGDINGDEILEVIIPLKNGGFKILYLENENFKLTDSLNKKFIINNIISTDIDCNDVDNLLLIFQNNMELTNYEYQGKDQHFNNLSLWNKVVLTQSEPGEMNILRIIPDYSYTGCMKKVYASFMHPNFNQHGLFMITFGQDSIIDQNEQIINTDINDQSGDVTINIIDNKPMFLEIDSTLNVFKDIKGEKDKLASFREQKVIIVKNDNFNLLQKTDFKLNWGENLEKTIELNKLPTQEIDYTINAPKGMKFDLNNRKFSWKPSVNQIGFHNIEARFYWQDKEIIKQFSVYVNDPIKIINKLPERDIIQIGETFRYQIQLLDKNQEKYVVYKMIDYPASATLNKHGVLKWKPGTEQAVTNENIIIETGKPYYYQPLIDDNNQGAFLVQYKKSPKVFDWKKSGVYETKILDSNIRKNINKLINRFYNINSRGEFNGFSVFEIFYENEKLVMIYNYTTENKPSFSDVFQNIFNTIRIPIPNHTPFTQQGFYNYSLTNSLPGVNMNSLGEITWVPGEEQIGKQHISFIVSDGYYSSEKTLEIFVKSPPEIQSVPDTIAFLEKQWTYQIYVKDINLTNKFQYRLDESPINSSISEDGLVVWTPSENQSQKDQFFNISVFDGKIKTQQQFYIHINKKPQIVSIPNDKIISGRVYEYKFEAEDPENQVVKYEAVQLPENAKFDPITGELVWKPNNNQLGINKLILKATDNYGENVQHEFIINVVHKSVLNKKTIIYSGVLIIMSVILFVVL